MFPESGLPIFIFPCHLFFLSYGFFFIGLWFYVFLLYPLTSLHLECSTVNLFYISWEQELLMWASGAEFLAQWAPAFMHYLFAFSLGRFWEVLGDLGLHVAMTMMI